MKNFNVAHHLFFIATTLLTMFSMHGMHKNNTNMLAIQEECIEAAKEHNKNNPLLIKDLLRNIFFYCDQKYKEKEISVWKASYYDQVDREKEKVLLSAYTQVQTIVAIHTTCQLFNEEMSFERIIRFCKIFSLNAKNEILEMAVCQNLRDNHLVCAALMQAGANSNTCKKSLPLFFYVKSPKIAHEFFKYNCNMSIIASKPAASSTKLVDELFKYSCNIHKIASVYKESNIFSYVIGPKYPSDLMKFYLKKKIVPQLPILHELILELKNYCTHETLRDEFLKKATLLLTTVSDDIKNNYQEDHVTPLDRLREQLACNNMSEEFKEKVADLFIGYGCLTMSGVAGPYYAKSPSFADDFSSLENVSYEYDGFDIGEVANEYKDFDIGKIVKDNSPIKQISLMEFVKNNNVAEVLRLIETGYVNINEQDHVGNTLLMVAIMRKNKKIIECLLNYGADSDIANSIGCTALDIAIDIGDDDLATALICASEANQR